MYIGLKRVNSCILKRFHLFFIVVAVLRILAILLVNVRSEERCGLLTSWENVIALRHACLDGCLLASRLLTNDTPLGE